MGSSEKLAQLIREGSECLLLLPTAGLMTMTISDTLRIQTLEWNIEVRSKVAQGVFLQEDVNIIITNEKVLPLQTPLPQMRSLVSDRIKESLSIIIAIEEFQKST